MRMKQVYDNYAKYCALKLIKPNGKIDFYRRLEEVGIQSKTSNGYDVYKTTQDELQKIAEREKWICEYDEETTDDDTVIENDNSDLTNEISELKEQNQKQQQTINELLAQLELLKNPVKVKIPESNIDDLEAELETINNSPVIKNKRRPVPRVIDSPKTVFETETLANAWEGFAE